MKNTEEYHGYFCEEKITVDDVKKSSEISKDLKEHFNIYNFRHSDNGEREFATIEPSVRVNFSGSFVTNSDLSSEFANPDDKYAEIYDYKFYESFGERLKLLGEHTTNGITPFSKLPSIWESYHKGDNKNE